MKKPVGLIIAVIIITLIAITVGKDLIIKMSVEKGVEMVTGLKLTIGGFSAGLTNSVVDIKNLRLFNPSGFKDRVMADVPEIYVVYDLPAILKGNIHLKEARLNLREFIVVRNDKGILNLDSLKVVQAEKEGKEPQAVSGKERQFKIDSLTLKIGKVLYKDYSRGAEPTVKEFDLNINERFTDLDDPYSVVSVVVVRALTNTSIANLTNFDIRGLSNTVSGTLSGAQEITEQAVTTAAKTMKTMTDTADQAGKTVEDTAGAVADLFKGFGSKK